jgi:hypothetical protein
MSMNLLRRVVLIALLVCPLAMAMARDANGCAYSAVEVAPRLKEVLGPRYVIAENAEALKATHRELEVLLLEIGHCRAVAQSAEIPDDNRQQHVAEWHALNQWLDRLVNFVGLNSRGDSSVSWRDEYALFAEIYEFEP